MNKVKKILLIGISCLGILSLISACNNTSQTSIHPCKKEDLINKFWGLYKLSEPQVTGETIPKDDIFLFPHQYRLFYANNLAKHTSSNKPFTKIEDINLDLKRPASLVYKIDNQGEVSISADYGNAPPYKFSCSYTKAGNKENISLKFKNPKGETALIQDFFLAVDMGKQY